MGSGDGGRTTPMNRKARIPSAARTRSDDKLRPLLVSASSRTALSPTALARVAMISPAGMTNRLDRLEAAGLIERRPDPADRRGTLVQLTALGQTTADRAVEDLVAAETALFAELSPAEHGRLDATLDKLIDRLDAAGGEPLGHGGGQRTGVRRVASRGRR